MQMKMPKNSAATSTIARVVETVLLPHGAARPAAATGHQPQLHDLAQVDPRMPVGARQRLARVEHGDRQDHAHSSTALGHSADEPQPLHPGFVAGDVAGRLVRIVPEAIPDDSRSPATRR